MANQGYQQPDIKSIVVIVLLVSLALLLPGLQWSLFGWVYIFLPLFAFFIYGKFGSNVGKKLLFIAAAISLAANLLLGSFEVFLFSGAMLLPGIVLHRSAGHGESPAQSGLKGCLTLIGGWLVVVAVATAGSEVSVYSQMLQTMDQALTEALEQYRQSVGISAEALVVIEATITQMKVIIPAIMPGILGSVVLFIIWTTMVLGNIILKKTSGISAWSHFRQWVLPEKLIWGVIGMGAFILIPIDPLPRIGINCTLLLSIIYCFQGMSITVFFMNKWKVPTLLRSFFYVMIVFQSLGTLILLFFGIADIWVDFRKLKANSAIGND
ncbi:MAG: DUF2232 domain-containing protein [Pseudomonadota bacterium]